ncbi:MAG TPA: TolC family protein [Vicinamibacteria bacterium]|nr:TolC family protein [Vicinamibacteria bacterium]
MTPIKPRRGTPHARAFLVALSLALASWLGSESVADDGPAPVIRLSLTEAIERARVASARLAQVRAVQSGAEAALRGARAARLPQLDAVASYTRNSGVPELTITAPGLGTRTLFPNLPDAYRTRAQVALPLFTGGRLTAAIDAAREQHAAAGLDAEGAGKDLVLEVTTAYLSLVTARESDRVVGEALATYDAHLRDARNRLAQGLAARNELLAVQVERDRAELARLQAGNLASVANANLLRLTGLPPDGSLDPTELLDAPAPGEATSEPGALLAEATGRRPELLSLGARVAAAEAAVKTTRSLAYPQVSLNAAYDYANPNSRVMPLEAEWKGTWSLGVNLAWTAFDGGRTAAAVAQSRAQADALRHQLEDLSRRVGLEVRIRILDLGTARAALGVAERTLESARENQRVSGDRYREGVAASSDLLDAETALLRAGLDHTSARAQLRLAQAQLDRALGR